MTSVLFIGLVVLWAMTLRPTWLGGSASVLTVRGTSMEPTYHYGDVIIAHRHDVYQVGDIIAYRVPEGDIGAGAVVIHRIIGGDGESGFRTQGDNNPDPDDWRPTQTDVLGSAWLRIPVIGRLMSALRSVPIIALLAGGAAIVLVIFGTEQPTAPSKRRHDHTPREGPTEASDQVDPLDDLIVLPSCPATEPAPLIAVIEDPLGDLFAIEIPDEPECVRQPRPEPITVPVDAETKEARSNDDLGTPPSVGLWLCEP
ncbi:MAG TPA: signal peptidase I [Acidimicrobiia bacterium]